VAELQAYEAFKAQKIAEAKAAAEADAVSRASAKAEMLSTYDTVPGFAARRGWHGNSINEHNYGEHLGKDPVFAYKPLPSGAMANLLEKSVSPTAGVPMEPRGRARVRGGGGVDAPTPFFEPNRLEVPGNAFDSKLFGTR
jgi:hypothetical protein